jgi:hypothetical protein
MRAITSDRLSQLIGSIYDCVIEPDRWPETMGAICSDLDCTISGIILVDLEHSRHRFFKEWNIDPYWLAKRPQYYDELTQLYRHHAPPAPAHLIDEPVVASRNVPEELWSATRYSQEWAKPQGLCDSLQIIVLRNAT